MDSVVRGLIVYAFLLVIFKVAGRRTLAQTTNFELVMLLILSETTQQAMVDGDHSMVNAFLLIMTLVGASVLLSWAKQRFPSLQRWLEGMPLVILENGKMHRDRMDKERIDEEDILSAARETQGLERLDQIKHAVVERSGSISIVPREKS